MKDKKFTKTDSLEGKVQVTDQKDATIIDDPKAPKPSNTEIHEIDEPKSVINTKKAAEVVAAGTDSIGGGALSTRGSATTFSGGAGNTRSDVSATTRENATYKSGSKTGRVADSVTRKIDYLDAEIFITKINQSKPMIDAIDHVGYNGNYLDEHAISQKCSGGVPGDPLFERSIDEISYDTLYYTLGQILSEKQNGEVLSIRTWDPENEVYDDTPVSINMGNFLLRRLEVTFNVDGQIVNFVPVVSDLSCNGVDEYTSRLGADTLRRFRNQSELDRHAMVSIAGNESDPGWSPLGDAIVDSTDQNAFLRLLDSIAGNYTGVSLRKTETAAAYQINKTAKDGARRCGPMAEMMNGCIDAVTHIDYGATHSVSELAGINETFYNSEVLMAGGAGLWLAVNDSLPKYTSKGKLLSLPLGPKSAIPIAKNNMNPLRADKQLFELLAKNELFSTIDGPYDPLKPIVLSDKIGLIFPINPFVGVSFDTTNHVLNSEVYCMHYENLRNKYNVHIKNYFAQGIYDWFNDKAGRIVDHLKKVLRDEGTTWNTGTKTITIPVVSSTSSFSLWDLIVCSSVPFMIERRLATLTPLIKYEKAHGYPYSNVDALENIAYNAAQNYSFNGTEEALTANVANPVAAMKVIMPEVFWPVAKIDAQGYDGHNGVGTKVVLPHYFVQNQFVYDQTDDMKTANLILSDDYATLAYPSTRVGQNLSFMDTIYGMSEEDYKLSLDRMVVYPGYENTTYYRTHSKFMRSRGAGTEPKFAACTYKYGLSTDGLVVLPYFAYASAVANREETLLVKDILSTPRELGLLQVAPAGLLTPIRVDATTNNLVGPDSSYLALSGPGFRVKMYHADGIAPTTGILDEGAMNINNNASLAAIYDVISCNRYGANFANGTFLNTDSGYNRLSPFTIGAYDPAGFNYDPATGVYSAAEQQDTDLKVYTHMRYMWNRIQRLPFVINPFDCNADSLTTSSGTLAMINDDDIFDILYYFGFCGFRASDYSALVNVRVKDRIAKGMNYVVDPFIEKTFLLK